MKNMTRNMTMAFLACMTLAAPAFAESKIVDQTEQNHHMNTKDLFNGAKPGTTPTAPGAQVTQAPPAAMPGMIPAAPTISADANFAHNMIMHHQSGIEMAKGELLKGKDPEMKALAQSIIDSQGKEVTQMQNFLSKNK